MNLNSPPSHFPMHQITSHDNDHEQPFLPNRPSPVSCHFFFDPSHDHTGFYDHHHLYRPSHHLGGDRSYGGSSLYETEGGARGGGLELTLWKKESDEVEIRDNSKSNSNPMRWMSSKMRVMQKMKKTDHDRAKTTTMSGNGVQQPSSSSTELSSNSSSYNNSSPIRVCSDCNTTKTPLWRSGPKGPKSLCNACGIRQRKARRAMAAAAAANGGAQPPATKIKLQTKGKTSPQLKKRCKTAVAAAAAAGNGQKRINFEDFLINLSKNLAFHRVFPDDEKDAAILLMALSSGLVNG